MADTFEPYPVSTETIRSIARRTNESAGSFNEVRGRFEAGHRAAVGEASGDLQPVIVGPLASPFLSDASEAARAAIWAACQLERFADAVDVYNLTSEDPRSISKLNHAAENAHDDGLGRVDTSLRAEHARLETNLDTAADEVAANLARQPRDEEVLRAWRNGNLPAEAIGAWPELNLRLTDLPYDSTDTAITRQGLASLTARQLADALADPNLNPEIREAILTERTDAVDLFASEWRLTPDTETRELPYCSPDSSASAQIVGPDGRLYAVTIPGEAPELEPGEEVLRAPGDWIPDDTPGSGWQTLGSRDGEIAYGDPVDAGLMTAYVIAGTAYVGDPMGDWQSVGEDQGDYVSMQDGSSWINDGTGPAPEDPVRGPAAPIPRDQWIDRDYALDKRGNNLWLAGAALEGLNNGQQAEYNRHFASEVTFQESDDGQLRAVINLYQVQSNDDELRLFHAYGGVNEDGDIVPVQRPESDE